MDSKNIFPGMRIIKNGQEIFRCDVVRGNGMLRRQYIIEFTSNFFRILLVQINIAIKHNLLMKMIVLALHPLIAPGDVCGKIFGFAGEKRLS